MAADVQSKQRIVSYTVKLLRATFPMPKIRDGDGDMKVLAFDEEVVFIDVPEWALVDKTLEIKHMVDETKTNKLLQGSAKPSKKLKKRG